MKKRPQSYRLVVLFVAIAQLVSFNVQAESLTGRATVIDGDTIEIHGKRIRLTGIDSPEDDQLCQRDGHDYRCGQVAANSLADLLGAKTVVCVDHGRDRYGRVLGQCRLGGTDLGRWMVQQGHALAYRRYSTDYIGDEDHARVARAGMWSGNFIPPWEYRAGKRQ